MQAKILDHERNMRKAIAQARVALRRGEVPIGAVLVDAHGKVLARAYNKIEKDQCQCSHAECLAIRKACKKIEGWRLNDCWLYVTLEPCLMCLGLIQLSRLKGVVFGGKSPLFGAVGEIEKKPSYAKDLEIHGGVLENECVKLLQQFFGSVRKKGKVEQ